MNQQIKLVGVALIIFALLLTTFYLLFSFSYFKAVNNISICNNFNEQNESAECIFEKILTEEYKSEFESLDDFQKFFEENFNGCFYQINSLFSMFGNNIIIGDEGEINLSDDFCVNTKIGVIRIHNIYKIKKIDRY